MDVSAWVRWILAATAWTSLQGGVRPDGSVAGAARCFEAAIDAAAGLRWIHEPVKGDPPTPRLRTQRRWLERAAHGLLLCQQLSEQVVERAVDVLGLAGVDHRQARRRLGATFRLRERGSAIRTMLESLSVDALLWSRLLAAGALGRAWGEARIQVVSIQQLRSPQAVLARGGRAPP